MSEDKKFSIEDFPNLYQIREFMVNGPIEFCIERTKLLTRFFVDRGSLDYTDPYTRQAEGLFYILKNKKPNIFPFELLAGSSTSKRRGVLFYPEFSGLGMWPELLTMSVRKHNPYLITIEEVEELNDILAFWTDKSVLELVRQKIGENDISYHAHTYIFMYMVSKFNCQSHTIPDYKRILEKGLEGLIKDANNKMNDSSDNKKTFYKALIKTMEGVIEYANNLNLEAINQAQECKDETRKNQLIKMADICKKVPAKPASGFWEALQCIWTCMNALYQEQNNVGFSRS